ncbi:hypothetical protein [Burkholderia anthina]|uniref:hypothetical protein n=1 Tax=Burkholderia anthina TaxID=179879 RepID=UPI0039F7371E
MAPSAAHQRAGVTDSGPADTPTDTPANTVATTTAAAANSAQRPAEPLEPFQLAY